ncbi:MAG TPA: glucosaminidase domain-containing protein [Terriglobia bacterium]|nr:glucosaminidase domain-containing protein [Terracidiphilus sp.]HZT69552.1 glucosaminidase domain-containing protein [Terriglobia bacterium]
MTEKQLAFLKTVTPPALETERGYGIPAAVTIAQAILESAGRVAGHWEWGASPLFRLANNPFGIKYSDTSPDAVYGEHDVATHEFISNHEQIVVAGFQHFPSLTEAFRQHALLLLRPRYAAAWRHRNDPRAYAICLGPRTADNPDGCGYATDPDYGRKLVALIDRCDLTRAAELYGASQAGPQQPAHAEAEADLSAVPPQPAPASAPPGGQS